jgi:hypothetical protein
MAKYYRFVNNVNADDDLEDLPDTELTFANPLEDRDDRSIPDYDHHRDPQNTNGQLAGDDDLEELPDTPELTFPNPLDRRNRR